MRNKSGYDLNTLVIIGNCSVCAIAMVLYYSKGANQYINIYTLILLCIFGAQNLLILLYEKKKRDPFVLLLMIIVLVFYMARVVTLLYDPWSLALDRHSGTSDDLNCSLVFIMLYNAAIFLGLSAASGKILYKNKKIFDGYPAKPCNIMIILLVGIVVAFYISLASDLMGRFAKYITSIFINLPLIILFTLLYLVINNKKLPRRYRAGILLLIGIYMVLYTLAGSRSALLTLGVLLLIGIMVVKDRVSFNRKALLIGTILIPVSVAFFISATYIRGVVSRRSVVSSYQLTILKESNIFSSKGIKMLCRPIFDRMGFLDYSAVVIRNHEEYGKIINFQYYFKSVIDNALTPGYDIFGTPRVAHSMSYISRGESVPTYEDVAGAYQSDMATVYGEYYVLFHGYPALIILFSICFIFKKIYLWIRCKDSFSFYLRRALVLYVFYLWVNSFGLDWMVLDLIRIIITVCIFENWYKMRRKEVKSVYEGNEAVGDTVF
ncbi:MAG: hypothetical protein ACFFCI_21205 [Promethearchaeota archaeon]